MKKNSLLMVAVAMAVAGGVRAGEPAQGTREPALTVVATNEAERKAAADLRVELGWPIEVVESCTNAVDFAHADFLDEFARRIFEPVRPAVSGYTPAAAKGRGAEAVLLIDGVRNHARYREFFESGLEPRLKLEKVTSEAGADAIAVRALRTKDGREAAFVVNKTSRKLAYAFTYGGNAIRSTVEPNWWNVHSARRAEVDFSKPVGRILPLNGTGGGPTLSGRGGSPKDRKEAFRSLNVASVRLHDIPHAVSNQKLVDVPQIFPLWIPKADPADPGNYYFLATDDYLRMLKDCGVRRITYRLGPSIEELAAQSRAYFTDPGDFDRYAEVCAGIVRHYTRGWANGFDAGVTHWEVWNEPDLGDHANWARSFDDYCRFYATVAKRLKREFPEIKVGGPVSCGASKRTILHFARKCAEAGAPVDFFSWHCYPFDETSGVRIIPDLREELAKLGFGQAELHLNEWHYKPCSWGELQTKEGWARWAEETEDGLNGVDAGAFVAKAVTRWQTSGLSVANYYMTTCFEPVWGLFTSRSERRPPWWALKFLGSLADGTRVADSSVGDLAVLAGVSADGVKRLVVGDFRPGTSAPIALTVKGVAPGTAVKAEAVTRESPFEAVAHDLRLDGETLTLPTVGGSSLWLLEFSTLPGLAYDQHSGDVILVSTGATNRHYRVGEQSEWTFGAYRGGRILTNGLVAVTFDNFGEKTVAVVTNDLAKGNPFTLRSALGEPGFLRATARIAGGKGERIWSVGYEPERIRKGSPRPADFDAWWDGQVAALERDVPIDVRRVRVPERCTDKFDFYRISFATVDGKRVYGYLSVPLRKDRTRHPACFMVPAAGEGGWTNDMAGDPDEVMMMVCVHDFEPPFDMKELAQRHVELKARVRRDWDVDYYARAGYWKEREDCYFRPAILGANRAVNWLARQEFVDPKLISYVGVSQGGGFGVILAGLNTNFNHTVVTVPALSDTMGYLKGRQSGWPRPVESQTPEHRAAAEKVAPYYDGANFASRIRNPIRVAVGLADTTCAPCAVWAMFNEIPSADKRIREEPGMGHGVRGSVWQEFTPWRKEPWQK